MAMRVSLVIAKTVTLAPEVGTPMTNGGGEGRLVAAGHFTRRSHCAGMRRRSGSRSRERRGVRT